MVSQIHRCACLLELNVHCACLFVCLFVRSFACVCVRARQTSWRRCASSKSWATSGRGPTCWTGATSPSWPPGGTTGFPPCACPTPSTSTRPTSPSCPQPRRPAPGSSSRTPCSDPLRAAAAQGDALPATHGPRHAHHRRGLLGSGPLCRALRRGLRGIHIRGRAHVRPPVPSLLQHERRGAVSDRHLAQPRHDPVPRAVAALVTQRDALLHLPLDLDFPGLIHAVEHLPGDPHRGLHRGQEKWT
mmetsp:Transcript_52027/g.135965  ORF Transcript_52027/g.135965 Transcript_52027/m.135965 type:complete len:245 (-) Transcript_52027:473-1207(-)